MVIKSKRFTAKGWRRRSGMAEDFCWIRWLSGLLNGWYWLNELIKIRDASYVTSMRTFYQNLFCCLKLNFIKLHFCFFFFVLLYFSNKQNQTKNTGVKIIAKQVKSVKIKLWKIIIRSTKKQKWLHMSSWIQKKKFLQNYMAVEMFNLERQTNNLLF